MPSEKEITMLQKSAIYDLQKLLRNSKKTEFTVEELIELMDIYTEGLDK